jgi:hypothetical protein
MKRQKSLRQLATELGVSHSYLSQVLHGKRPASDRVAQALNGKQVVSNCEATMGLKIRFLQGSVGSSPSLGSGASVVGGQQSESPRESLHSVILNGAKRNDESLGTISVSRLTNRQVGMIIIQKKVNMVKKITFYDKNEAIQYQIKMRKQGYLAKMIRASGKYEVIVAGETPDWESPMESPDLNDLSGDYNPEDT